MDYFIGVDGGKAGGICVVDGKGNVVECMVMPVIKAKPPEYDRASIIALFKKYPKAFVTIEKVLIAGAMTSKVAAQSTGWCLGFFEGVSQGLGMRYEVVAPQRWQKVLFEGSDWKKNSKAYSIRYAQRMAPGFDWKKSSKCKAEHDGMTDAFCLAEYGRKYVS